MGLSGHGVVLVGRVLGRAVSAAGGRRRRAGRAAAAAGGRFGRVDRARRGAVQVEALDPRLGAGAFDRGLDLGLHQLLADRLGHFLEGRGRRRAALLDLDHVPAERACAPGSR